MRRPWRINSAKTVWPHGCSLGPCRILLAMLAPPSSIFCGGVYPHFVAAKFKMRKRNSRRLLPKRHRSVKVSLDIKNASVCGLRSPKKICLWSSLPNGILILSTMILFVDLTGLRSPKASNCRRFPGFHNGDSPGDVEPSQDIIWDPTSPTAASSGKSGHAAWKDATYELFFFVLLHCCCHLKVSLLE